jgi:DNA end-binding protein Ku
VLSTRERILALEPRGKGILAYTLRSEDEVRNPDEMFASISGAKPDAAMISIAEKIIEQLDGPFDPTQFVDRYEQALKALIADKQKGRKVTVSAEPDDTNVIDLMSALRASLAGKAKAAKAPAAKPDKKRAPAKRRTRDAG